MHGNRMRRRAINDPQRLLDHLLACGWTRREILERTGMSASRLDGIFSGELVADIEELAQLHSLVGKVVPMIEHRGATPSLPERDMMHQQGMRWKLRVETHEDWDF